MISVDCTDCKVSKIAGADFRSFKSHKFKEPELRYEVALCIKTGFIVWVMGPFACGDWPDVSCFRFAVKGLLEVGERVEADDGYVGEDPTTAKVPGSMAHSQDDSALLVRSLVRRRHETANKRFKQFNAIANIFTRHVSKHALFAHSVINIVQIGIMHGEKNPFQVHLRVVEPSTWPENLP